MLKNSWLPYSDHCNKLHSSFFGLILIEASFFRRFFFGFSFKPPLPTLGSLYNHFVGVFVLSVLLPSPPQAFHVGRRLRPCVWGISAGWLQSRVSEFKPNRKLNQVVNPFSRENPNRKFNQVVMYNPFSCGCPSKPLLVSFCNHFPECAHTHSTASSCFGVIVGRKAVLLISFGIPFEATCLLNMAKRPLCPGSADRSWRSSDSDQVMDSVHSTVA